MKKYDLRFARWVGIACIVLAILVGCVAPAAEETAAVQLVTATPTIIVVTSSPTATLSPTLSPTAATETPTPDSSIPLCTFTADAAPEVAGPSLNDYVFSEPQVVLTHTSAIGIAGWLPDSERLLITRQIPGQPREYVETFNTQTGELQRYGERHSFSAKPVWLTADEAVIFADITAENQTVIRLGQGNKTSKDVISEPVLPYLAVNFTGSKLLFFTKADPKKPKVLNITQLQSQTLTFELPLTSKEELHALGQTNGPDSYRTIWHPAGNQIAFYNDTGFYLANLAVGQLCEVDIGFSEGEYQYGKRWAIEAKWSPDGRYLTMLTTVGDPPVRFSDLAILDTVEGELYSTHPKQYLEPGQYYVANVAWAPNNLYMAILAVVRRDVNGFEYDGLFIVDSVVGVPKRILPDYEFGGGDWGWELVWSPNGQQLATTCPTRTEGRLCVISVTTH